MKLYNLAAGSNPRRVRIYLAEKGIEVPTVDLDMTQGDNATPEFLGKNPLGKLPVLEFDDGLCISESMAIIRYFEALHPEPPLLGAGPREQAVVEMWNRRVELELALPIAHAFQHGHAFWAERIEQVPGWAEFSKKKALKTLGWLDDELADREYIAGERFSVADISAYAGLLLGKVAGVRLPETLQHMNRWWQTMSARPSARA